MVFGNSHAQEGSSIVGALVAVAVIGTMAGIYSTMFSNNIKISKKIEEKSELEDLRRYVTAGTDTAKTKAARPTPCNATTLLSIKRPAAGTPALIENQTGANRSKVGPFYLMAKCTNAANEYQVYYSKVADTDGGALFSAPKVLP